MANNRGKQWETKIRECWRKCFPKGILYRVPDQMNGYKQTSKGIADFIGFIGGTEQNKLYLLEAKSHEGNTIPWSAMTQIDTLSSYIDLEDVRVGFIIWFIDHDKVIYISEKTVLSMQKDGLKSININKINEQGYEYIDIPAIKKRVFMEPDLTFLKDLKEGW